MRLSLWTDMLGTVYSPLFKGNNMFLVVESAISDLPSIGFLQSVAIRRKIGCLQNRYFY